MKVAVFGCGPAGLLAAHAVNLAGKVPDIYSIRRKAVLPGAMYIHVPIPGITPTAPDDHIEFVKHGTREGYAEKVYGNPDAPCSWDHFEAGLQPAWSMYAAYEKLWRLYEELIQDRSITHDFAEDCLQRYDLVISTVPAPVICSDLRLHDFESKSIWVTDFAPGILPRSSIVYNGDPRATWYRAANIFGHEFTEYGQPQPVGSQGVKPLSNNCNCHPEIVRAGRFGEWRKGVLAHHAFAKALSHAL